MALGCTPTLSKNESFDEEEIKTFVGQKNVKFLK